MTLEATDTRVMMAPIDPGAFRFPQPKDHFSVKLTTDARQYVVVNDGHKHDTLNVVTFKVADSGARLVSCTCHDFAYYRTHGRLCKHSHVAYHFHISRMKAQKAVTQQG